MDYSLSYFCESHIKWVIHSLIFSEKVCITIYHTFIIS
jgi:hypothetical protein